MALFYGSNLLAGIMYLTLRIDGYGSSFGIPVLLLCILPYLMTIHRLRKNYVQKHRLFSQFENFDFDKVECSNESDRNFVYAAIGELYGSNEAFTNYVKGPLRDELLVPIANSVGPQKYTLLIVSPIVSMLADLAVSLWKGGASAGGIIFFAVSVVVLGVLLLLRTSTNLAILLSDHFAEPAFSSSVFAVPWSNRSFPAHLRLHQSNQIYQDAPTTCGIASDRSFQNQNLVHTWTLQLGHINANSIGFSCLSVFFPNERKLQDFTFF